MAELLIEAGADVNAIGRSGNTTLMNAARHDNVKLTRLMLRSGVKVNFKVNTHSGYFNALSVSVRHFVQVARSCRNAFLFCVSLVCCKFLEAINKG